MATYQEGGGSTYRTSFDQTACLLLLTVSCEGWKVKFSPYPLPLLSPSPPRPLPFDPFKHAPSLPKNF